MAWEVYLTDRAQRDLTAAREYISRDDPEAAERWYTGFLRALLVLEENPGNWSLAPEDSAFSFELRQYFYRSRSRQASRALFTVVRDQVRVLAIRRPGQSLVVPDDLQ